MTSKEVYNRISKNRANHIVNAISIFRREGNFCLIGGLAVNCYVEPVYTMDADFVVATKDTSGLVDEFKKIGFDLRGKKHSINITHPESRLMMQITTDDRYLAFPSRAKNMEVEVLEEIIPVACLDDIVQAKMWAYQDMDGKMEKRGKDRLDLIRIAFKYPKYIPKLPLELAKLIEKEHKRKEQEEETLTLS
jgi:hypothetical protein